MKINHDARIKDALYYLSEKSGASLEKAEGMLIGVISTIMALNGKSYTQAIEIIKPYMPADYRREAIPESWRKDFPEYKVFDVINLSCLHDGCGWSVNDAHFTGERIAIPAYHNEAGNLRVTDEAILKQLKADGWIKPRIRATSIEIDGDPEHSLFINDAREAKPLYELRS